MITKNKNSGFSLVEVLLAISILVLLLTGMSGAFLYGQESIMLAGNRARAVMLAEEGLEAIRNIRDEAFDNLSDGVYGLTVSGGNWTLSGSSDTTGIFNRQIRVASLNDNRKEIISTVNWQQNAQRTGEFSSGTVLSNWRVEKEEKCQNQSDNLEIDYSNKKLILSGKTMIQIYLENTSPDCDIVIKSILPTWTPNNPANRRVLKVRIGGTTVWTGTSPSGTVLDITDTTLAKSSGPIEIQMDFNSSVSSRNFTFVYTMIDDSTKTISGLQF